MQVKYIQGIIFVILICFEVKVEQKNGKKSKNKFGLCEWEKSCKAFPERIEANHLICLSDCDSCRGRKKVALRIFSVMESLRYSKLLCWSQSLQLDFAGEEFSTQSRSRTAFRFKESQTEAGKFSAIHF
jgi:hypothetical protein